MMSLVGLLPLAGAVRADDTCGMKCCTRLKKALCKRTGPETGWRAGAECGGKCCFAGVAAPQTAADTAKPAVSIVDGVVALEATLPQRADTAAQGGYERVRWQRPPPAV